MTPISTVLIDTYNHERFIEQALSSVLEQDFPASDMEILVVDDGSTDRTPDIVRRFAPRVRLLRKQNGGQASAFNAGIPEARGEIVAFLDGDDWWAPNKLSRVVDAMAKDQSLGIVGHGIVVCHRDGSEQSEILREGFRFRANTVEGAKLFRLRRNFLGTSRMTIRTRMLRLVGPVPEQLVVQADEYLFTLAAVLSDCCVLPDTLTYYRLHSQNGFLIGDRDPQRLNRRAYSLASMAEQLTDQLVLHRIDKPTRRALTSTIRAEACQARLCARGGFPFETWWAEWQIFRVHNPNASPLRLSLKAASLLPALVMPPRSYYEWRPRILQSSIAQRLRRQVSGDTRAPHVEGKWGAARSSKIHADRGSSQ